MSWRLTIVVWIVALAGLAAIWTWRDRGATGVNAAAAGPRPLLAPESLPIERVTRITVRRGTETPLVFERAGEGWVQVEPFDHPMDPFSVRQLMIAALSLETSRVLDEAALGEEEVTLSSLSLAPPEATVEFTWPDGSRRVDLGRLGVAGRAFVRVDERGQVDVVGQALHERVLGMDPREWRQRRLLPDTGVNCTSIEIAAGAGRTVLEREQRRWRLVEPVRTRVNQAALEQYLQALASAQSSGFLVDEPDDLKPFGLDQPVGTLTVHCGAEGEQTHRLLVGSPIAVGGIDRFAMVEGRPAVLRLSGDTLATLFPSTAAFVDPTPAGARAEDVKRIRVHGDAADFMLERDLDVWRSPDFDQRQASSRAVNQLLQQLTAARAGSIAVQPFPTELEVGFITLFNFELRPIATVRIAHEASSGLWALEAGDGVLRLFPETFSIALTPEAYGLTEPGAATPLLPTAPPGN